MHLTLLLKLWLLELLLDDDGGGLDRCRSCCTVIDRSGASGLINNWCGLRCRSCFDLLLGLLLRLRLLVKVVVDVIESGEDHLFFLSAATLLAL